MILNQKEVSNRQAENFIRILLVFLLTVFFGLNSNIPACEKPIPVLRIKSQQKRQALLQEFEEKVFNLLPDAEKERWRTALGKPFIFSDDTPVMKTPNSWLKSDDKA